MKKGLSLIVLSAILLATVIVACKKENLSISSKDEISQKNSSSITAKVYTLTAKEYFKGLFYGENPFANDIPMTEFLYDYYQNLSPETKEKSDIILNFVINRAEANNPNFFNDFGIEITSKDRSRIYNALIGAGQLVYTNNLFNALNYFESYSVSEFQDYINSLSVMDENTEIVLSLSSETVISTILDAFLALLRSDLDKPNKDMISGTSAPMNFNDLANHLVEMDLRLKN